MSLEPVIYASQGRDIFVIDIPTSIAAAQTNRRTLDVNSRRLASCPPLAEPYIDTEPKSTRAAARVSNHAEDEGVHEAYARLIKNALDHVKRDHGSRRFCHERILLPPGLPQRLRKRTAEEAFGQHSPVKNEQPVARPAESDVSLLLDAMAGSGVVRYFDRDLQQLPTPSADSPAGTAFIQIDCDLPESQISAGGDDFSIANDTEQLQILSLKVETCQGFYSPATEASLSYSFFVPPLSGCWLGDCEDVQGFRAAARFFTPRKRGGFDFVLLDPPWPNRSARRKLSYKISRDIQALKRLLLAMDIETNILPGGFVAVWATNKAACRNLLLDPGGIFDAWNVRLVEEWIWVKVTSLGKPVTAIEGWWRKPYEVLLIAQAPQSRLDVAASIGEVNRRIILGVPDLHSRKPCLKQLVEDILLQRSSEYQAMEIFARHLVAGWFSVGNEVLKFNWKGYWANLGDEQDSNTNSA